MPRTALGAALHRIDAWLDSKITGLDPGSSALGPDFEQTIDLKYFPRLGKFIDQIKDIIQKNITQQRENSENNTVGPVDSAVSDVMDRMFEIQHEITSLLLTWFQNWRCFDKVHSFGIPLNEVWFYKPDDAGTRVSTGPDAPPNIKISIETKKREFHTIFSLVFTFN